MTQNNCSFFFLIIAGFLLVFAGCGGGGGSSTAIGGYGIISTGMVTLSWEAPTLNIDGSPLADLGGYKIYYGPGSGNYTFTVDIGNSTSTVLSDLTSGTWCFATTSYDASGNESTYSNEVCTEISV